MDGALAVLAGVDAEKAETKEARWAFSEWTQLVKRRFGGPGDALAARQGPLGAQPTWPPAPDRGWVMVTASVDITALKARHPLGDTVAAAGVRLRGRGRVRQGVCPFHDEAEGSFTVYGDSERFYCFGCGEGGDVLDFIQRAQSLTLPEAIERLGGSPGLAPRAATRPAGTRRPRSAALPPRDPTLLTAAARFYAGWLRRHTEAREYLASRGVGPVAAARLGLGYSPGGGLRQALESLGFSEKRIRDSGLFMERGAERFAGMVVVPDASGGLVRWLAGRAVDPDRTPRFQALPGPKPVLGLGHLGPAPAWAVVAEASSTGSPLPDGASHPAPLSAPRAWSGSPPSCGAVPASSSPSMPTTRAVRRRSGFSPCSGAGPPRSPSPQASATLASLRPFPTDGPPSSACSRWRPAPPAPHPVPHSHRTGGAMPDSRRAPPAHGFP